MLHIFIWRISEYPFLQKLTSSKAFGRIQENKKLVSQSLNPRLEFLFCEIWFLPYKLLMKYTLEFMGFLLQDCHTRTTNLFPLLIPVGGKALRLPEEY